MFIPEQSLENKIAAAKAAGLPERQGKQIVSMTSMSDPFGGAPLLVMYDQDGKRYVE